MTNTAHDVGTLINQSQLRSTTITVDYDRELAEELRGMSDGHVDLSGQQSDPHTALYAEYWGEDVGGAWRIHMRAEPQPGDDGDSDDGPV